MKIRKIRPLLLIIIAFAGYNICQKEKEVINISDLAISNIEALANNGEGDGRVFYCLDIYGACGTDNTVKGPLVWDY